MQQSHPSVSYLDDTILFPGFQCLGTGMTSSLVEIALKSQCSYSYANTKVSFQRVTLEWLCCIAQVKRTGSY
ncbi:hypothetical protein [Wolbachia endosymbiont (group A) of Rhorus exstirpatorius]|uniref:hypothetical protein n=1 Tax=Wolbachia endosymbiont (group A) of Rhorus exstirpatorius TaxID=3066213 RepID=UPI0033416238